MPFDTRERSADTGRPVELYEFRRESLLWRYTSADRDYEQDFQTYKAASIRRGGIEQSGEINRANLRLTLDPDLDLVTQYRAGPPSDAITLTLRQVHAGDTEAVVIWTGRILSVTTWRDGQAEMTLEPAYTSLRRTGLRRIYQKQCPHVLYGSACGVNPAAFRTEATVAEVNGATVIASAFGLQPDGWWEGGVLEWEIAPNVWERRFIVAHTANSLELATQPLGLEAGMLVRVYPGCDHSVATCAQKFGNLLNYGGMPYIPSKNPYGNDPIY